MQPCDVLRGESAVVLGIPHAGTFIPDTLHSRLNAAGLALADTDWHIDKLYEDLLPGATLVKANFHRYVVDANRDPQGTSLYPGQNTTTLCPLTDFDGKPIYVTGEEPATDEIEARRQAWHAPYHAALKAEIDRVRKLHGTVLLYDCHSIRSKLPFLFDGRLPDLNIGTNDSMTCAPEIEDTAVSMCKAAEGYSFVLNGRFKGGWTTRHYGRPETGVHAVQMELAQRTYLTTETAPFAYDADKAGKLRKPLKTILNALAATATSLHKQKQDVTGADNG